ncbi:MAG: hypothetical protein GC137_07195 [Alphaproteobacteria bacterium]|nr:hypothetical protein [Alphaproteobacteria bacterium]
MEGAVQTFSRPYFHFNPRDEKALDFARSLMNQLGQFETGDADAIINIGGDGTIIRSFHRLPDLPNFALRPPGSNSTLFNGHHNIEDGVTLKKVFETAVLHRINPLKADIEMSDHTVITVYAYQDIVARSFNAEAVLSGELIEGAPPRRVMGGGWIIATPLGSTAINETHGGKVVSLGSNQIVVTMHGISNTNQRKQLGQADQISRVMSNRSDFTVELSAKAQRRESAIDYDNYTILPDGQLYVPGQPVTIDTSKRSIRRLTVSMDHAQGRQLLLNAQYRTPGLSA